MKLHQLIILLAFLSSAMFYGQPSAVSCNCPQNDYLKTKTDTIFQLSNGKMIALCGYKNPDTKPVTYSEFILGECGQDTIIGFWDAMVECRLRVEKENLLITHLVNLPVGINFEYQDTEWKTQKLNFGRERIDSTLIVNRGIRKYTQDEIKSVLKSYKINAAKRELSEDVMVIVNELFVAILSGNKTARKYFKAFATDFGEVDGSYGEEYDDLVGMLLEWDSR